MSPVCIFLNGVFCCLLFTNFAGLYFLLSVVIFYTHLATFCSIPFSFNVPKTVFYDGTNGFSTLNCLQYLVCKIMYLEKFFSQKQVEAKLCIYTSVALTLLIFSLRDTSSSRQNCL